MPKDNRAEIIDSASAALTEAVDGLVIESLDLAAERHPQVGQIACLAEYAEHGQLWRCLLPLLHGGAHVSGPMRWSR